MQLAELMDGLAGRLKVPPFGSDGDGSYAITFDGHLAVRCLPEPEGVRLIGIVGKLPQDRLARGDALRRLLRAALARAGDPAILALDEESGELQLHRTLPAGEDAPAAFEQALGDFVNRLAEWQRRLAADAAPPPTMPPMMLMR